LRDATRIHRLFAERLTAIGEACDPGFGYDLIRLSALTTEQVDPAQTGLASDDHGAELAHLIDRLSARFGSRRVTRLVPCDTHIPEYAVAAIPAQAARLNFAPAPVEHDSLGPARPLRLFADRSRRRGAGWPAGAVSLAACFARSGRGRRAGTHRDGMVAQC
jgi:protein ImuB